MDKVHAQDLIRQIRSAGQTIADNAETIAGCYNVMASDPVSITIDISDSSPPKIQVLQRIFPDDLLP